MYAVKGGWVGQTFALAKSNDSGGKKSRVRRSKEDRKALVQSFIKRYQISNNGSFPSLNLTHKEVGGSFYTVREIVRDIIQENRVLGPAKPTEDEHGVDQFNEKYPLGSISIDCQTVASLNETHSVFNEHERICEEAYSALNEKITGQDLQRFEDTVSANGINHIPFDRDHKESELGKHHIQKNHELLNIAMHANKKLESVGGDMLERPTSKVTPLATDVVVEIFPINSASSTTEDTVGPSVAAGKLLVNVEQEETKNFVANTEVTELMLPDVVDGKSMDLSSIQLLETSIPPIPESIAGSKSPEVDIALKEELTLQTANQDLAVAVMGPKPAPENGHSKIDTNSSSSQGVSLSQQATKHDKQQTTISEEGKHSTLNRSKLPSWEGSSRRAGEEETNLLLGVIKAFISAFVKFWTE